MAMSLCENPRWWFIYVLALAVLQGTECLPLSHRFGPVEKIDHRTRSRLQEESSSSSSAGLCASILASSYISDFQEQMNPCSCRELRDGRHRVECKYPYCEHCVGSTCGVQDAVDIYTASGEKEFGFLCVSYTAGPLTGTEVCIEFGTSAETEVGTDLFCAVEIDGRQCPTCQYDTCNGLTHPRVDCGDVAPPVDFCNSTLDTEISIDSPLAMFRTDFTFSSCYLGLLTEEPFESTVLVNATDVFTNGTSDDSASSSTLPPMTNIPTSLPTIAPTSRPTPRVEDNIFSNTQVDNPDQNLHHTSSCNSLIIHVALLLSLVLSSCLFVV